MFWYGIAPLYLIAYVYNSMVVEMGYRDGHIKSAQPDDKKVGSSKNSFRSNL